jgi:glycosyltransferase involved in cell wall biosynthesis
MTPLVSIILPVYNGEAFLDATLDSALGQSYRNIEVIVVDDGSRDRSPAIVDARAAHDPRLRLIRQANRGVAAARNRGIAESRGEFIAPLDADDLWDPSKIERQVARMLELGEDAGLVYSWWLWIDSEGIVLDYSPQWRIEGASADALLQVNYIGCASIPLFRRTHLTALGGYDETLREGCEDWDLSLRMAERARTGMVPAVLVAYRRSRGSMSTGTAAMWRAHGSVIARLRRRRPDVRRALIRHSQDQFRLYLAGTCFWGRHYGGAVRWGVRAMRSSLGLEALPYVLRMLARGRTRAARRTIHPGVSFADADIPSSLIPYDRIYQRRFKRLQSAP